MNNLNANFLEISPNNKIPAIVDHDNGVSMMESGAILMYLSEKTKTFLPNSNEERWRRDEWIMFQMASLGPMLGQVHHFVKFNAGKSIRRREIFWRSIKNLWSFRKETK